MRSLALPVLLLFTAAACASSTSTSPSALVVRDIATAAGVANATNTHGENCVADFDGDGTLDVLLSTHAQESWLLLRGQPGGRFEPYDGLDLPRRDRHGCAVADFNGSSR